MPYISYQNLKYVVAPNIYIVIAQNLYDGRHSKVQPRGATIISALTVIVASVKTQI